MEKELRLVFLPEFTSVHEALIGVYLDFHRSMKPLSVFTLTSGQSNVLAEPFV
jgi:hypothetical protein